VSEARELELAPGVSIDVRGVPDHETVERALRRAVPGTALFFFDRHLRVILAGGPALAAAGMPPESIEGRLLEDVLPPASFARLEPCYRGALDSGEPGSFTSRSPAGTFRVDVAPVRGESGTVIGLYALARAA
jgi:hypothetical protein